MWFLIATLEVPEPAPFEPADWIGVDRGVVTWPPPRLNDVLDIQIPAALANGELSPDELREIAIFLTHYVGWPLGARLNVQIERLIARHARV